MQDPIRLLQNPIVSFIHPFRYFRSHSHFFQQGIDVIWIRNINSMKPMKKLFKWLRRLTMIAADFLAFLVGGLHTTTSCSLTLVSVYEGKYFLPLVVMFLVRNNTE